VASTAEFGIGAVPGTFEGGDLALYAGEEFGGGGVGEERCGERGSGSFGEEGAVEVGLDALEAALLPVGAEHGIDVEGFGGGFGAEVAVVGGDEDVVVGGIFAGSMPCFRALKREADLPSAERGPVDFRALARLALICAGVAMTPI
jgi:hypothetical protein